MDYQPIAGREVARPGHYWVRGTWEPYVAKFFLASGVMHYYPDREEPAPVPPELEVWSVDSGPLPEPGESGRQL